MKKAVITQTDTITWVASGSPSADLLKDGYITHIDVVVQLTPSASLVGTNQPDAPFRVVENLQIKGGSQTYFTLPSEQGGRLWHYMMRQLMGAAGIAHGAIVAPELTYQPILFRIHPGSRPLNPDGTPNYFDLSAFIPAIEESTLRAIWQTTANSVLDDVTTITSAVMKFTLYMVQGSPAEIVAEQLRQHVAIDPHTGRPALFTPAPQGEVYPTTGTSTGFSTTRDLPTGGFLRGIGVLVQDATATRPARGPDEITGFAIKMPSTGGNLVEVDPEVLYLAQPAGNYLRADDAVPSGVGGNAPAGVFYLSLKQHGQGVLQREYGIDMGVYKPTRTGDWKIGMSVGTYAAGDDVLFFHDILIPYLGYDLKNVSDKEVEAALGS